MKFRNRRLHVSGPQRLQYSDAPGHHTPRPAMELILGLPERASLSGRAARAWSAARPGAQRPWSASVTGRAALGLQRGNACRPAHMRRPRRRTCSTPPTPGPFHLRRVWRHNIAPAVHRVALRVYCCALVGHAAACEASARGGGARAGPPSFSSLPRARWPAPPGRAGGVGSDPPEERALRMSSAKRLEAATSAAADVRISGIAMSDHIRRSLLHYEDLSTPHRPFQPWIRRCI